MARQACLVLELDLEVIVPLSARYSAEKTDLTKCSFSLGNRQHAKPSHLKRPLVDSF